MEKKKREREWHCLLHFLIYNVGVLIIMDSFYRETLWFRLLMPTCNLVLALVIVFLFASLTGTNYFRMLLEAVAVDAVCGIIVHIDRKLFSDPIMIFIALLAVLLECVAYYYILKRKHKMLLRNKRQMERYYRHAAKHMQDMEAGWNFLGGGVARKGIFGRMMREYALRTEAQCRILLNRWRNICID
ncbi:hypothetical protein [Eubacterium sp. An3]|uniref:hypothetical protein n=1 Tax=Eubacterium sp. An3 TaxID=1965628 RepID=UPI001179E8A0|nr:hypothetical protein [Eubacterium sp. An3]